MIKLKRINGKEFMLNSELILLMESTPDTLIVLTDGTKYIVADSIDDVYEKIIKFRSDILLRYRMAIKKSC
ncbi:MAG TPA: flagellar FlbD family protein [Candidatus Wallbacteria bacterium]|nr:flagellar FlbD family protein [Candidatus Wallbacteria bacterium]